jgi:hypothetical protein
MPDCFDKIERAASNHAQGINSKMYQSIIECLDLRDTFVAASFLKWVNNMIYQADDEQKQAKFLARLETQGIFDKLAHWVDK